jgi:hypothetical protein
MRGRDAPSHVSATFAQIDGRIMSAFVRARKPTAAAKSCYGPTRWFLSGGCSLTRS